MKFKIVVIAVLYAGTAIADPNFPYPKTISKGGYLPEIGDVTDGAPAPSPTSRNARVSLTVAGVHITTMDDAMKALKSWECTNSAGMLPDATWDIICTKNDASIALSGYKNGSIISTDISIK